MPAEETLPPDEHAVLSILLRQGRGYDEVAALLHLDEDEVRQRGQSALRKLGAPAQADLSPFELDEIGDYLLGQQTASARAQTRALLDRSPAARAWARRAAAALKPMAGAGLPGIPAEPEDGIPAESREESPVEPRRQSPVEAHEGTPVGPREETDGGIQPGISAAPREPAQAFAAVGERTAAPAAKQRRPRRGGAVILVATGLLIAAVVILIIGPGGSSNSPSARTAPTSGAGSGRTATAGASPSVALGGRTRILTEVNLNPTNPGSAAAGFAEVLEQGHTVAVSLSAQDLPPSQGFTYVLWLYNSRTNAEALGSAPAVTGSGSFGPVYQVLPSNGRSFHELILTRETEPDPSHPGPIVLAGDLSSIP